MYSYDADSAAFIKRAQGLTASDCARAGAAVGAAFGRGFWARQSRRRLPER